jgi:threonine dehydrogenase-like Zn-dependent dehydrogenase
MDKWDEYRAATGPLPEHNRLWPLYGAGLESLGHDGQPVDVPFPACGPEELLVRHDACGLCFSDVKVIKLGPEHPRIYRDMRSNPVTLGHEVAMTVVGVGQALHGQYHLGDRFVIQADIFVNGVGYAYGYEIQGGLSQYGLIDRRVLDGDDGNYLISVQPGTGYAEAALTEPWACVTAAYGLTYRTGLKAQGTAWIIGTSQTRQDGQYTISAGFDESSHPARLLLTDVPAEFAAWLKEKAAALGVEVLDLPSAIGQSPSAIRHPPSAGVDDIVLLGADAELIEAVSPHLADHGILAVVAGRPMPRPIAVDVGRVHYNRWVYVGGRGPDIAEAYSRVLVRAALRPGGRTWFVGAGGPMGRMHVQRALQVSGRPGTIVCTDVSDARLEDLSTSFAAEAQAKGVRWLCLNPGRKEEYAAAMAPFTEQGFDDIVVLAPIPAVISDVGRHLAHGGVMNIFAGVGRGTIAHLDLSDAYLRDVRVIGHSASTIDDLRLTLFQAETGQLSPNRSVAAIGSLNAARDGLQSVLDTSFSGKVVIFPNIRELPLTALSDLERVLPSVHARLEDGREWTVEAEEELLRVMLP